MPIINKLEVLQTVQVVRDAVNYGQLQRAINGTAKEAIVKANDDGNITVRENSTAKGGKEYTVVLNYKITVGKGRPRIL